MATKDKGLGKSVVTFDLSRNLINVLGEEHYPYAEYLYHEVAANAWDEDASEFQIVEETSSPASRGNSAVYRITFKDDGNGMDLERLREYFRVGESSKRERKTSERLGRPLIGRIGVGKVAILKVARKWTIATERHLGVSQPQRLRVSVDVDQWINGAVTDFDVELLEPEGRSGTEIVLEGVTTRLREDRILRHLQRLPLRGEFRVWRNGSPIAPKQWHGIARHKVDLTIDWLDNGWEGHGKVTGEIWIRPRYQNTREQAYVEEPKTERDGLSRDPAGIEVRVNGDAIVREFFGHESHGHSVNRIWGWVEAPFLPIVGNRTDYLRDSPAGAAFYERMKTVYDEVFSSVKSLDDSARPSTKQGPDEVMSARYAAVVNRVLSDHKEFAPVIRRPARTQAGRPAKDRFYPVRPTGKQRNIVESEYGSDIAIAESNRKVKATKVVVGNPADLNAGNGVGGQRLEAGEISGSTPAGVKLRLVALGVAEAMYRWETGGDELELLVNTEHKLYKKAGKPGSPPNRLYCSWVVTLALAEQSSPAMARLIEDYVEVLAFELYDGFERR